MRVAGTPDVRDQLGLGAEPVGNPSEESPCS